MDPIKNMISSTDPVDSDPSPSEAEAALRRMLTSPPLYSDSLPAGVIPLADRQRRKARIAGVLTLTAAAVAAGVLVATNLGSITMAPAPAGSNNAIVAPTSAPTDTTTNPPTVTPSPEVPVPTSAAPPPATPTPEVEAWQKFTSAEGKISFDYPAGWTVATPPRTGEASSVDVDVADEEGSIVASLHYGPSGGIGGGCRGPVPYSVLDSIVLDLPYNDSAADTITPRFTFRALQEPDHVTASYGLTSNMAGSNGTSCMFYNVVSGPPESPLYSFADTYQVNAGAPQNSGVQNGAKTFATMDDARAYMQTAEYLNAKRMITSLKIKVG